MTLYPADGGLLTGTPDKDYNILWFTEACLRNVLRMDQYIADAVDAEDHELAAFFRRAQRDSRRGADEAKQLLVDRFSA
jgi:hypothetical protein